MTTKNNINSTDNTSGSIFSPREPASPADCGLGNIEVDEEMMAEDTVVKVESKQIDTN